MNDEAVLQSIYIKLQLQQKQDAHLADRLRGCASRTAVPNETRSFRVTQKDYSRFSKMDVRALPAASPRDV
jgi:hypothetical protein